MPFAYQSSLVALTFYQRGNCRMFVRDSDRFNTLAKIAAFGDRLFHVVRQPGRISAGLKSYSSRRANRRCRIGVRKTHSLTSELVEIRCLVIRTSIATKVRPAKIIGENENYVRTFYGSLS